MSYVCRRLSEGARCRTIIDSPGGEASGMARQYSGLVAAAVVLGMAGPFKAWGGEPESLKDRLVEITRAQEEARNRYHHDLEGKTTAEVQRPAVDRYLEETARNTGKVLDLVRKKPNDPAVVKALQFVITYARAGPGDESYQAMEILQGHVRDPGMGELSERIFYFVHAPVAESLIRSVLRDHPNRDDRGQACYALADFLKGRARMVRRVRERPETIENYVHERHKKATEQLVRNSDPGALDREAEALMERMVAEFADVPRSFDRRTLGEIGSGLLFQERHLAVGKPVPEVTGKDHEGKTFALSEYRGKVVVLTFSGNWCGPCVGMYPQERTLIKAMSDKPFVVLSVNTDEKLETLRQAISSGEITWRCWWDGGTSGPITTRWGIESFPSIFVLDKQGTIRFKNLRGEELEKAVTLLLKE